MSSEDWAVMSEAFGRAPYKVDSRGICLCSRPRLYWIWPLNAGEGVLVHPSQETGWSALETVNLTAEVNSGAF